jgi:hypothetical protein
MKEQSFPTAHAINPKDIVRETLAIVLECKEVLSADQDQLLVELVTSLALARSKRRGA